MTKEPQQLRQVISGCVNFTQDFHSTLHYQFVANPAYNRDGGALASFLAPRNDNLIESIESTTFPQNGTRRPRDRHYGRNLREIGSILCL